MILINLQNEKEALVIFGGWIKGDHAVGVNMTSCSYPKLRRFAIAGEEKPC